MKNTISLSLVKTYSFIVFFTLTGCNSQKSDWIELFNGDNFNGWHTYGAGESYDGWYAKEGILGFDYKLKKGTKSSNLITDDEYTNFELSIDWKISPKGNSGIFWGVVENDQYEHPYQTGPEIQILDDNWSAYIEGRGNITRSGSLYGLLAPSKIVSKPANTWNNYLLHINHLKNIGYLKFNGKKVLEFPVHGQKWNAMIRKSSFAKWPGFGNAKTGHISLQDHGGKVEFKNIRLRIIQ